MSGWPQFVSTFFRTFAMTKGQKIRPCLRCCLTGDACLADCAINRSCQKTGMPPPPRRSSNGQARLKLGGFLYHLRIPMLYVPPSRSSKPTDQQRHIAYRLCNYSSDAWSEYENRSPTNVTTAVCHRFA